MTTACLLLLNCFAPGVLPLLTPTETIVPTTVGDLTCHSHSAIPPHSTCLPFRSRYYWLVGVATLPVIPYQPAVATRPSQRHPRFQTACFQTAASPNRFYLTIALDSPCSVPNLPDSYDRGGPLDICPMTATGVIPAFHRLFDIRCWLPDHDLPAWRRHLLHSSSVMATHNPRCRY